MTNEKWIDPIVEEVHQFRRDYSARFNGDIDAMFEDMRQKQEEARKNGAVIVTLPARRSDDADTPAA